MSILYKIDISISKNCSKFSYKIYNLSNTFPFEMLRILIKYPIFCQFKNKRQRRIFKIGVTFSFLGVIYLHREAYRRNIRIGRQQNHFLKK